MIILVKLSNGVDFIATYDPEHEKYSKVRIMQPVQDDAGRIRVGLVPFFITHPDAQCAINSSHIITAVEAPKNIEDMYLQETSGLDLRTKL